MPVNISFVWCSSFKFNHPSHRWARVYVLVLFLALLAFDTVMHAYICVFDCNCTNVKQLRETFVYDFIEYELRI